VSGSTASTKSGAAASVRAACESGAPRRRVISFPRLAAPPPRGDVRPLALTRGFAAGQLF
jgi:hypothetical protein